MAAALSASARLAPGAHQARPAPASRRTCVAVAAKSGGKNEAAGFDRATGFVAEDNSGRANIFPTTQKAYLSSSTADAAARQGLGGVAGGAVLAGVLALVAAVTVFSAKAPGPETLQSVAAAVDTESLSAIAGRISASL